MTKLEFLTTWFEEVWHKEDFSAIYKMMDASGTAAGLGVRPNASPQEFESFLKIILTQIKDVKISVDMFFEKENWMCAFCTLTALQLNTNKKIVFSGSVGGRIENDKLYEAYNHWDFISFFEQLGLLPEGTFISCLSGKKIGKD